MIEPSRYLADQGARLAESLILIKYFGACNVTGSYDPAINFMIGWVDWSIKDVCRLGVSEYDRAI